MSINVWQIGQNVSANEFYDNSKNGYIYETDGDEVKSFRISAVQGEIFAAKQLENVCNLMSESYETVIEEQNEYIVDIDGSVEEISKLEEDMKARIKQLEEEIKTLQEKKHNGTITEEEEAELDSKTKEIDSIESQTSTQISDTNEKINKTVDTASTKGIQEKNKIATNYSEMALEKGKPLSETKDKRKSFWRKTFGGWNKSKYREAGKNLLEAGNNLKDNISMSATQLNKINKSRHLENKD